MKFIHVEHPDGGELAISVDRISSAHYRQYEDAGMPTRLIIDLNSKEGLVKLFGEEADRVWAMIKDMG